MPSERVQRRIDRLLDDAEEAADQHDWTALADLARRVLLIDPDNGDAKTLLPHPGPTTHQRLRPDGRAGVGIGDGLRRLSVGLEDVEDVADDLARGFAAL